MSRKQTKYTLTSAHRVTEYSLYLHYSVSSTNTIASSSSSSMSMPSAAVLPKCSTCAFRPYGSAFEAAACHSTERSVARTSVACATFARFALPRYSLVPVPKVGMGRKLGRVARKASNPVLQGSSAVLMYSNKHARRIWSQMPH